MDMSEVLISSISLTSLYVITLPTHFLSKLKDMDKIDGADAGKIELIRLEFLIDPSNPENGSKCS
jgi:hypothetical protein